ncbi:MAG: hypothetical protein EP300_14720 [Gammaproteobacteria bacterium]|nr:MAG: hypothetical protein EP300_14720 [Gammaproteobacteria bacterium]
MTQLTRLQREQLREVAEPIWRNIISAARDRDYARFSRGFSNELLAKLSEEHFRQSCEDFPLLTTIEPDFELSIAKTRLPSCGGSAVHVTRESSSAC